MLYKLDANDILHLLRSVTELDHEVCGEIIQRHNDILQLDIANEKAGERINGRALCSHEYKTPAIYHTHPRNAYAYPSIEDISKISKRTYYHSSLIATKWGMWQIFRNPGNNNTIELTIPENRRMIERHLVQLHNETKQSSHVSKDYDQNTQELINDAYRNINRSLDPYGVRILFKNWNAVGEYYNIYGF